MRGKIELPPGPCLLRLSAKDYCHAWLDGGWLGQGPAPGVPNAYWYQEYPAQGGSQVTLALHLYYQGLVNRVWNSGDGRYGLWAEVCCGEQERMIPEWRYQICDAYSGETVGYDTQFLENFDSRLWLEGWEQPGYDDSGWTAMVPADWDFPLLPQPTAYLERKQVEAISRQKISGGILLDFGRERVGTLFARAIGQAGDVLTLRCGEELDETGRVRFDMRCNCRYEEAWTLRDGVST